MSNKKEREGWLTEQIAKSKFFHQKLHEWRLLEISYELDSLDGSKLDWDLENLAISQEAWNKVIHRGIKPIKVFCHPEVLRDDPRRVSYYRMLAMVSQKSMVKVELDVKKYEDGRGKMDDALSLSISRHLNSIISILIEEDNEIDEKEFDLWRGMAAGSQAQGSWQNFKGDRIEFLIKDLVEDELVKRNLLEKKEVKGKRLMLELVDGRKVLMGSEPDIGVYKNGIVQVVIEVKGGIDTAGVLERFGAALKSLRRAKQKNKNAITVLIMQEISITQKANEEIENSKSVVDYFFTVEDIFSDPEKRKEFLNVVLGN